MQDLSVTLISKGLISLCWGNMATVAQSNIVSINYIVVNAKICCLKGQKGEFVRIIFVFFVFFLQVKRFPCSIVFVPLQTTRGGGAKIPVPGGPGGS
jgi:hypothetical protein